MQFELNTRLLSLASGLAAQHQHPTELRSRSTAWLSHSRKPGVRGREGPCAWSVEDKARGKTLEMVWGVRACGK